MDKLTKQFRRPHPGQEGTNVAYQLYLHRDGQAEDPSLLQWLQSHTIVANKSKALWRDKVPWSLGSLCLSIIQCCSSNILLCTTCTIIQAISETWRSPRYLLPFGTVCDLY